MAFMLVECDLMNCSLTTGNILYKKSIKRQSGRSNRCVSICVLNQTRGR